MNGWGIPINAEKVYSTIELLKFGLVQPIPFKIPNGKRTVGGPVYIKTSPTTIEEIYQVEDIPPTIPDQILSVSAAQALLALDDAGLLDQVTQICENHPVKAVRIWFAKATVWERENPYVLAMAIECNITDSEIDALFLAASKK